MRREGSPLTGLGAVLGKELADHLSSIRMRILELLVVLFCLAPVSDLVRRIRDLPLGEDRFLFLYLFSLSAREWLYPMFQMLSIVLPVLAIGIGFDAVNAEFNRRTMSRILAQPVYRDAVLLGKFLAGITTLGLSLLVIWLLIVGIGILAVGVPPTVEELGRSLLLMVCSLAYAGIWLAISMLFSTLFRSGAASVLSSLGLWLLFWWGWPMVTQSIADMFMAPGENINSVPALIGFLTDRADFEQLISRISPATLYTEAAVGLLSPDTRTLQTSTNLLQQLIPAMRGGAIPGAPLSFFESVLLIWPHLVIMIAATILLLAITYIIFQRQEVRA